MSTQAINPNNLLYLRIKKIVMKKTFTSILIFIIVCLSSYGQEQQLIVPYTLADRDRAIITKKKISALDSRIEVKFESQQRQLDDIKVLFYWGFGILITLLVFMLGYMIWDRRTALQPALEKAADADTKSTNLIRSLR
ncbi:MAG: hypothetical protein NTV00_03790, partial [Methylococcales bacterium]|nr:hypothetical protein [Methylococcales bacterium]